MENSMIDLETILLSTLAVVALLLIWLHFAMERRWGKTERYSEILSNYVKWESTEEDAVDDYRYSLGDRNRHIRAVSDDVYFHSDYTKINKTEHKRRPKVSISNPPN